MTKKRIIIIVLAAIIIGFGLYMLYGRPQEIDVKFTSNYPGATIKLQGPEDKAKADNEEFAFGKETVIKDGQTVRLSLGSYQYSFSDKNLDNQTYPLTITKNSTEVKLDPNYSSEVLGDMLNKEIDRIKTTINNRFTSNNYDISQEKLYHRGEWLSCALTVYQQDPFGGVDFGNPDNYDNYYVVFKKGSNNNWKLVGGPALVISKPDNPSIPAYILDSLVTRKI